MLNVELITDYNKFIALEPEWNAVLKKSVSDNPFLTFEWLKSWITIFGDDVELFVIIARENSILVGMAPLVINRKRQLVFMGYPLSDYSDIIVIKGKDEALNEILNHIFTQKNQWNKIILDQLRQDESLADDIIGYLSRNGYPARRIDSDSCPAMILDDIESARKMYYKRKINTFVNWYNKRGDFAFNVYADTDEALMRLDDLFEQHRKRRDLTPFPSLFEDEKTCEFFKTFLVAMSPEKWARVFSLTLDGEFLALYLNFEYNNTLYLYTTSFNLAYSKRSPGQVVLRYLFDYSIEHNLKMMDFTRGGEAYKERFANAVRQNSKIIIYGNSFSKLAADLFFSFRYSKIIDILYRNKPVQNAKLTFLFYKRKSGIVRASLKAIFALFTPDKRIR